MLRTTRSRAIVCGCALVALSAAAAAADNQRVVDDKRALSALQSYVGGWRGVGQLRRGSSRGAWTEESEWAWRFANGRAELVADVKQAKYFSRMQLQPGDKSGQFVLVATPATDAAADQNQPRRFTGTLDNGVLVLTAVDETSEGEPSRISVRLVAKGDRMVVLFERRLGEDRFTRLAEVGATRKGSSFAKAAASGPECVVTGGLGTIAVEYQGKKYFVCCTGCRDLFNDDPAGVLAEYRQRKADEKAEQKDK